MESNTVSFPVLLPSKGLLYEDKMPDGTVQIRPLTTKDESVLFSPVGDVLTKINKMVSSCVLSKEVDPQDLLLVDRFAILLAIRSASFGEKYNFEVRCQHCRAQFKTEINIHEELNCRFMGEPNPEKPEQQTVEIKEPFEVHLPDKNVDIQFRLLRGKDEVAIARKSKQTRMRTVVEGDPAYTYRLALAITAIDDREVHITEAEHFANTMSAKDSRVFSLAIDEVEAGIDTTVFIDCLSCGAVNEIDMPLTLEFFRPSSL